MHYVSAESVLLFLSDDFSSVLSVMQVFCCLIVYCLMMQYVVYMWEPKASLP